MCLLPQSISSMWVFVLPFVVIGDADACLSIPTDLKSGESGTCVQSVYINNSKNTTYWLKKKKKQQFLSEKLMKSSTTTGSKKKSLNWFSLRYKLHS